MTEEQQLIDTLAREYLGGNGDVYTNLKTWFPDSENDPWIEYQHKTTGKRYSCRLEAFLTRFTPHTNSDPRSGSGKNF
jgi:hypothetical protein